MVRLGLTALLKGDPPDLVVSGINRGENVGRAPWYSGTVGAAREAAGEGFKLMVDANQGWPVDIVDETPKWDLEFATQFAQAIEPYDVAWLEEPLWWVRRWFRWGAFPGYSGCAAGSRSIPTPCPGTTS